MSIRVVHIELGRQLYGGAKQVTYLINSLNHFGDMENHLICPKDSEIALSKLPHCHMHPIRYRGETDIYAIKRVSDVLKKVKPDIIHIHSRRGADTLGAILAYITGIPAVCTRRVDNKESRLSQLKYQHYTAVVSISKGVFDVVSRHCSKVKHQSIIHSAVDLNEFKQTADRNWLCNQFSIPHHHHIIANFAQLIPRKGQADIILAMKEVQKNNPNVTCLLFGKGKLQVQYQELINKHHLQNTVKLCGFTQQVSRILPSVDIVLHPAYAEGLGVILLQAGACKRAVISTHVGGIPEIVTHNKTGIMVEPGNISEITNAINKLIENDELRIRLGEQLYKHVAGSFSPKEMARRYYELYQQII